MFCALTTPSPEERTDLGVIFPFIVFINFMVVPLETTAAGAMVVTAPSEDAKRNIPSRLRIH